MTDPWTDPWTTTEVPVLPEGTTILNLIDTKISVLDGATLPRSLISITLTLSPLRTVRNLHLLPNLRMLDLSRSVWLDTLDTEFPSSLQSLLLNHCAYLTALPKISHTTLQRLSLYGCHQLLSLPDLPQTLESLCFERCDQILEMPFLPDSLRWLTPNLRFEAQGPRRNTFMDTAYAPAWREYQRTALQRHRMSLLREELMMVCWHPRRVDGWLRQGEDVLDMMMGC